MPYRVSEDLARAAARVVIARGELVAAVKRARRAGMTYRAIAAATGLSHETIRRLVAAS